MLPFAIVGLAVALYFGDVVAGSVAFFWRDLSAYFAPFHHLVAEGLRHGEFPLWNPALQLGLPLGADASAMPWYLPGWLCTMFAVERAMACFILGHLIWGGCGAIVLARTHKTSRAAATLAGISFALGGYVLGAHWNLTYVASAVWLPWLLAANTLLMRKPSPGRAAAVAVCWSAVVFSGDAQLALMVFPVLVLQFLFAVARAEMGPAAGWLTASGALAVGIGALQWVPGLAMALSSRRGGGLELEEIMTWSMPPLQLFDAVLTPEVGARLINETVIGWVASLYPGLLAGALAVTVALQPRGRARRFVVVTTILFTVLALGRHTPVYGSLLTVVPGLGIFRYPHKLIVVSCVLWSLATAFGFDAVLDTKDRRSRMLAIGAGVLAALAGWALLARGVPVLPLHATVTAAVLSLVLILVDRGVLSPRLASWALVAVGAADLLVAQLPQRLVGNPELYSGIPHTVAQVEELREGSGAIRIHVTRALESTLVRTRTHGQHGAEAWVMRAGLDAVRLAPNSGLLRNLHYLHGHSPLEPSRKIIWTNPQQRRRLLDMCGVAALIDTASPRLEAGDQLLLDQPGLNVSVVENTDRWPRAYVLDEESAAPLLGATSSAVDLPPIHPLPGSTVQFLEEGLNRVELQVTTPQPSWLILADRQDPDWRAWIDGDEIDIATALGMLRAVRMPSGEHRVLFRYRPRAVFWGGGMTALTLLLILGSGAVERVRRKRPAGSTCA